MCGDVPQSLQDDVLRLLDHNTPDDTRHELNEDTSNQPTFCVEDWMLICQHRMQVDENNDNQISIDFLIGVKPVDNTRICMKCTVHCPPP